MRLTRILDDGALPEASKARALLVRVYLHGAAAVLRKHRDAGTEEPRGGQRGTERRRRGRAA